MKGMKKMISVIVALMLVLGMSVNVFAAETTYSITINNTESGHSYEAYQIFAGDLSNDKTTLSNVVWGDGVTSEGQTALGNAADKAAALETGGVAAAEVFADAVAPYLATVAGTSTVVNDVYVISGLEAGYYLVKDKDGSLADAAGDAYTDYILKVVGDVSVDAKSDTTTVIKKVQDINDSTGETSGWQDSADYDIGDHVPFQLTATLGDNVSNFAKYEITFNDTLSAGLTYDKNAVVKIDGNPVTEDFTIVNEGNALTISCGDVKELGAKDGSVITVDYTAELNSSAVVGAIGNTNKVTLTYSNDPNSDGTGTTPEDTVIVFTYKVVANKVTEAGDALEGAGFTLYKKNAEGTYVALGDEVKGEAMTTFAWTGLDDGDYKLVETTTPDGYNTINDILFTITATHEIESVNPTLIALSGGTGFTADMTYGSLSTDVINYEGSILPSTGGMGTTILYIVGAILVIGAGVLLVTRKRMHNS